MKKILITYHMEKCVGECGRETAETCITLPMQNVTADYFLKNGIGGVPEVEVILRKIARLQGYRFVDAVHVQEVPADA